MLSSGGVGLNRGSGGRRLRLALADYVGESGRLAPLIEASAVELGAQKVAVLEGGTGEVAIGEVGALEAGIGQVRSTEACP